MGLLGKARSVLRLDPVAWMGQRRPDAARGSVLRFLPVPLHAGRQGWLRPACRSLDCRGVAPADGSSEAAWASRSAAQVRGHLTEAYMLVDSCIPVIPSADLEKSLRFWVDGLGLSMDRAIRQDGRLVGCMVHNERLSFWLNQRAGSPITPPGTEGIRLYWAPGDLEALRE